MRKARIARLYWCVIGFGALTLAIRALLNRQIWLFFPTDIAVLISPFVFLSFLHWANRVTKSDYNRIVENHPLLARLIWQPDLGPRPVGSYRRR